MKHIATKILKAKPLGLGWEIQIQCPYECPGSGSLKIEGKRLHTHVHHLPASGLRERQFRTPHCSGLAPALTALLLDIHILDPDLVLDEAIERRSKVAGK